MNRISIKTYLERINPIVSLIVLLICLWAAIRDEGTFKILAPWEGGISAYFIAKGLFCSSALFILGKILAKLIDFEALKKEEKKDT
jgi:hypothetical protein